jgi:hypothetical protein
MFTKFHSVSFIASTVKGLEVDGKELVIRTTGDSFVVPFSSASAAKDGLAELTDILNSKAPVGDTQSTKTDSVLNAAQEAVQSLQGVLGTLRATATNKVQDLAVQAVLDRIDSKLEKAFDAKDDLFAMARSIFEKAQPENKPTKVQDDPVVYEKKETPKPENKTKDFASVLDGIFTGVSSIVENTVNVKVDAEHGAKKLSVEEFKQLFGTALEPRIGDLTDKQLKEFISEFVDGALQNERVQSLFETIKAQFGKDEAESAIDGYKNLIYTFSVQNVEMTLSEIIARYFNGQ